MVGADGFSSKTEEEGGMAFLLQRMKHVHMLIIIAASPLLKCKNGFIGLRWKLKKHTRA